MVVVVVVATIFDVPASERESVAIPLMARVYLYKNKRAKKVTRRAIRPNDIALFVVVVVAARVGGQPENVGEVRSAGRVHSFIARKLSFH